MKDFNKLTPVQQARKDNALEAIAVYEQLLPMAKLELKGASTEHQWWHKAHVETIEVEIAHHKAVVNRLARWDCPPNDGQSDNANSSLLANEYPSIDPQSGYSKLTFGFVESATIPLTGKNPWLREQEQRHTAQASERVIKFAQDLDMGDRDIMDEDDVEEDEQVIFHYQNEAEDEYQVWLDSLNGTAKRHSKSEHTELSHAGRVVQLTGGESNNTDWM